MTANAGGVPRIAARDVWAGMCLFAVGGLCASFVGAFLALGAGVVGYVLGLQSRIGPAPGASGE